MRQQTAILLFLAHLLVFAFSACSNKSTHNSENSAYNDTIYAPQYATGFAIRGDKTKAATIIETYNPWQGAQGVENSLFIARNGEIPPTGFKGQILKDGANRIVAMSSTHVAMLDRLGACDRITGISGKDYVNSGNVRSNLDYIYEVGYEGNINYENIIAANPDIVLLYGVSGASSMEGKLKELGIPYIYIGDYLEESPLGKAEWMIVLAELIGKKDSGIKELQATASRYNGLKGKAASVTHRPTVMLNAPYGDSWMVAPDGSYISTIIRDAGGKYVYDNIKGNVSKAIDLEEAYTTTASADFWLNAGNFTTLRELQSALPKFSETKPVINKHVYSNNLRTNANGGNDYFESAIVNPDFVLGDVMRILHPEIMQNPDSLVYYRHLEDI
ncbi:MAG: ABC transporter substrate-binding protein [Bacteroidales bacterium]|nr:ABC transporter substrate-binding protein [Bacteroidales bacterium]